MAPKITLADKYAQRKNDTRLNTATSSGLRSQFSSFNKPRLDYLQTPRNREPTRTKYPELDLERPVKTEKLPGLYGSPIKSLSYTPRRYRRPTRLYKVLELPAKFKVSKDRPWMDRKGPVATKKKSDGIFLHLRSFLSKFSVDAHEKSDTDYLELQRLAAKLFRNDTLGDNDKNTVDLDKLLIPRGARTTYADEFDQVDSSVQNAKTRREESKAKREKEEYNRIIEQQRQEKQSTVEEYERKLYLMERDFEARTHALQEKVRDLERSANNGRQRLAESELDELRKSVEKENEHFLLHRREAERVMQERQDELNRRESEISKREAKVDKMVADLRKNDAGPYPTSEGDVEDPAVSLPRLMKRAQAKSEFDRNHREFSLEEESLRDEEKSVARSIRANDEDVISFYDLIQSITERILKKERLSVSEERLLEKVQGLLKSLDHHAGETAKQIDFASKMNEYAAFFGKFDGLFARNVLKAKETYTTEVLLGIERAFVNLRKNLYGSLSRRATALKELDAKYDDLKVTQSNYSDYRVEQVVGILDARTQLLSRQRHTVEMLKQLNELTRKLHNVATVLANQKESRE